MAIEDDDSAIAPNAAKHNAAAICRLVLPSPSMDRSIMAAPARLFENTLRRFAIASIGSVAGVIAPP
jgi:hypothetical protein